MSVESLNCMCQYRRLVSGSHLVIGGMAHAHPVALMHCRPTAPQDLLLYHSFLLVQLPSVLQAAQPDDKQDVSEFTVNMDEHIPF